MSGYIYTIYYNTKYSKDVLWIVVGGLQGKYITPVEACEKALELLREAGQDGDVEITGVERLV